MEGARYIYYSGLVWDLGMLKVLPLNIYSHIVSYTPSSKAVYSTGSSCNEFDGTIAVRHSFVSGYSDSLDCILFAAHPLLLWPIFVLTTYLGRHLLYCRWWNVLSSESSAPLATRQTVTYALGRPFLSIIHFLGLVYGNLQEEQWESLSRCGF